MPFTGSVGMTMVYTQTSLEAVSPCPTATDTVSVWRPGDHPIRRACLSSIDIGMMIMIITMIMFISMIIGSVIIISSSSSSSSGKFTGHPFVVCPRRIQRRKSRAHIQLICNIQLYLSISLSLYIYIYRERQRERDIHM